MPGWIHKSTSWMRKYNEKTTCLIEQQLSPLDEEKQIEKVTQKEEKKITSSTRNAPYLLYTQPARKKQSKLKEIEETGSTLQMQVEWDIRINAIYKP